MPTWAKVILALFAVLTLLVGGTCAGFYFWIDANKDEWRAKGDLMRQAGRDHGSGKTKQVCVDEAVKRASGCRGGMVEIGWCRASTGIFLQGCWEVADDPLPGICDDVPPKDAILKHVGWGLSACETWGYGGNENCAQFSREVASACRGDFKLAAELEQDAPGQ